MAETLTNFDIAEHLESDADIQAFLCETVVTGSIADFLQGLAVTARQGHD